MIITYTLKQVSPSVARIVRGRRNVGTITKMGDTWHGRLRVDKGDPVTASDGDLVKVFNTIVDRRAAQVGLVRW